jgi:hypothetical protein
MDPKYPRPGNDAEKPWPVAAKGLLSEREQSLFDLLHRLYPDHRLFVQVALSQLIDVPLGHPGRWSIRARFSQLVADFVLCRPDMSILAVIELKDRTHEWPLRKAADARKTKALGDAGLRLVRIPAGPLPSIESIRAMIDDGHGTRPGQATAIPAPPSGFAEPSLRLVEDWQPPGGHAAAAASVPVKSPPLRAAFLRVGLGLAVLILGWYSYSQVLAQIGKGSIKSIAQPGGVTRRANLPSVPAAAPSRPAAATVVATQQPDFRSHEEALATAEKMRRKARAWAAAYVPPTCCEHPADWNAQVECGNQYMRAKQAFERKWAHENDPDSPPPNAVVLDNQAVSKTSR